MNIVNGRIPKGWTARLGIGLVSLVMAGCVQIETPDKPIVINLNINIRQEIVYRLDSDAKKLIDKESEIF